jgi:hypothetical protein
MSVEKTADYAENLLSRYEKNGIMLDNKTITTTKINNHPAYVLETKIKYEKQEGIMYQVVLEMENTTILFMASTYTDLDNYLKKFKKTVETIKMK